MSANFDEKTYFRVGVDDETTALLMELAEACHAPPEALMASILKDVLLDDAEAHGQIHAGTERSLLN